MPAELILSDTGQAMVVEVYLRLHRGELGLYRRSTDGETTMMGATRSRFANCAELELFGSEER
jgi:hypothetical protein